jgi:hypothetical protein
MAKPSALAAFSTKRPAPVPEPQASPPEAPRAKRPKAKRALGDTVALTVRVSKADWARLHQLAIARGETLQTLTIMGFSRLFEAEGLPPMKIDAKTSKIG